ncbi:unnamed protein product [Paramecium primaurelia]|uniref:Uncharacterized protein n=1 Tax=Paramecium primaurelia TaxID=5886 RepID=A0A8S1NJD0_PARPR|nr:unnamed protein product [Paramecium primaurelia]
MNKIGIASDNLQLVFDIIRKRSQNERSSSIRKDHIHIKKVSQRSYYEMKGKLDIRAMPCKSKNTVKTNNLKQPCQNKVSRTLKGQMKIIKTKFSVGMQKDCRYPLYHLVQHYYLQSS